MGVISIRRGLMPGFTELAADMDLAAHLGTELFGVLIRLAHIAEPAVDLPGSWVVSQTQGDLATFLGFSTNKCQRVLADLAASGAVVKDAGLRLGRGLGSTNTRYFIAAVPGLTVPAPRPTPPRSSRSNPDPINREPQERELNNSVLESSVLQPSALHSVSASQSAALTTPDSTHVMTMMNESSSDEVKTAPSYSPLSAALAKIGWSAPIPMDQDPVLLAAVATWMHGQTRYANKAAYLHTVIKKGELATFAAAIGVAAPISDSTQTLNSHFMSSSDYVALCAAHPDWAELVAARAQEVAAERGTRVRMALLCEVAADIPVPDAISASSISEALA